MTGSSSRGTSAKTGLSVSFSSKGASGIFIGISVGAEVNNEFSAASGSSSLSATACFFSSSASAFAAFLASTFSACFSFHFAKR